MTFRLSRYFISLCILFFGLVGSSYGTDIQDECKKVTCPPHVWVKQPGGVDVELTAGESTLLVVEARNWGVGGRFSIVVDCYYGGGKQDGHMELNYKWLRSNRTYSWNVYWTPWEAGPHGCAVRVYDRAGCHVYSNNNVLNLNINPACE